MILRKLLSTTLLLLPLFKPYMFENTTESTTESTTNAKETTKEKSQNNNQTLTPQIDDDITSRESSCDFRNYSYYTQISGNTQSGQRLCGGAILTSSVVITSGQCCNGINEESVTVYFGFDDNNYQLKRKISKIGIHPYIATLDPTRADMIIYDACLLTLDSPIELGDKFVSIQIGAEDALRELLNNKSLTVEIVGYGLQYTAGSKPHNENPIIFRCDKSNIMPMTQCGFSKANCDGHFLFCTGSNHVYLGSPVVYNNLLVGLISFEGTDIMYHLRIDTIQQWLQKEGVTNFGWKRVENVNNAFLLIILLRHMI